jgi:hypothetical protein
VKTVQRINPLEDRFSPEARRQIFLVVRNTGYDLALPFRSYVRQGALINLIGDCGRSQNLRHFANQHLGQERF